MPSMRNKLTTIAAIGAAALSGAAIAGAATSGSSDPSTSTTASGTPAQSRPAPPPRDPSMGGHMANGETEKLLTGETASKVEAAAKEKVEGGTVERVETDADTDSAYEAHVRKADGSEVIVYVDKDFKVTGTDTGMRHP